MEELTKESMMAGLLFGTTENIEPDCKKDKIILVDLDDIRDFGGSYGKNKFKHNQAKIDEIAETIKLTGVLEPILIRPDQTGQTKYECIAGYTRRMAARQAGEKRIPAIIRDCDDEQAVVIMAVTNQQREDLLPSERAWLYRIEYDAIKKKVGRNWATDSNCAPGAQLRGSAAIIAENENVAVRTVNNYIQLSYLTEPLLDMVDDKVINVKAGIQLSYLPEHTQQSVCKAIEIKKLKINESLAIKMKESLLDGATIEDVYKLLTTGTDKELSKTPKKLGMKINKSIKKKYFPSAYDDEQINDVITKLLKEWAKDHNPDYSEENESNE